MVNDTNRSSVPPYVAFRTFLNLLTRLEEGVPRRIDRSYWGQYYGGTIGTLLMAGLRFLGLVEGQSNIPTQALKRLVDEKESSSRKQLLGELLKEHYAPIFTHIGDISTATSGLLDEAFRQQYKIRDDTLRKAISFFVHASQYAEIPVSKHIAEKTRTRTASTRSSTRSNGKKSKASSSRPANEPIIPPKTDVPYTASPQVNGNTKTVTFQKGGSVSLTYSVDLFDMDEGDRKFLLRLIDQLRHYEQGDDDYGEDDYDEEEMEEAIE